MPVGTLAHQSRMRRLWNNEGGGAGGNGSDSQGGEGDPGNTNDKTYTQADIDKLNTANKAIRDERDGFKAQIADLNQKLAALENKDKPEIDVITGERDDFKTKYEKAMADLRDATAKIVVADAARNAKAISPNAIYAMIAKDLEYDESNRPTNVAELVAGVQKSDPNLFGDVVEGSGDGGAGTGANTNISDNMNDWIRGMAGQQ